MAAVPIGKLPKERLQKDLAKYKKMAVELGATDAKVIRSDSIVVDERVLAKCMYPRCSRYGTNANCPPYSMTPDMTRTVMKRFRYGVLVKIEVPANEIAGAEARDKALHLPYVKKIGEIVAKIEAQAFYDGYYLALAFSASNCKSIFCADEDCQALEEGKPCVYPEQARSSLEAVGIDVFMTATRVGWDIYPIGRETKPEEIPYGLRMGLVMIT